MILFFAPETRAVTNICPDYTWRFRALSFLRLASGRFFRPVAFYEYASARRLLRSLIPWEIPVRVLRDTHNLRSLVLINCRVNNTPEHDMHIFCPRLIPFLFVPLTSCYTNSFFSRSELHSYAFKKKRTATIATHIEISCFREEKNFPCSSPTLFALVKLSVLKS